MRFHLLVQCGVVNRLSSFAPSLFTLLLAAIALSIAALRLPVTLLSFAFSLLVGGDLLLHSLLPGPGGRRRSLLEQGEALTESHSFTTFLRAAGLATSATSNLNNTRALHYAMYGEY